VSRLPPVTGRWPASHYIPKEDAMIKVRNLSALLALSSVALLPACSMFGGGHNQQASRSTAPSQSYASAQPSQPASAPQQNSEMSRDMIQQVQQKLQQQGMYRARVDGVWGPSTEAAVRSYQQQHNLSASGQLDSATLAALDMGPNQNYGSTQSNGSGQSANNGQSDGSQRYSNYNPPQNNANNNNNNTNTTH
jgi:peptidoglycan hydrolase-like protein with peptidoglycan-binding domain